MAKTSNFEEVSSDTDERDDDESSDGDDEEELLQKQPRSNAVYNPAALHENLEEIGWPDGLDWMDTLCVDYNVEEEIDVEDDLAREMAFYTQALEGTREAFTMLVNAGKPFLRPPDYYAEMVKSDSHMLKVKDVLLSQKKQMEESEERRKAREAKRFSKEVQAQKLKQRAQEKKQNIESVKKWRKMRQDQGFDGGNEEFPVDFDEGDRGGDETTKKKRRRDGGDGYKGGASRKFKGSEGNGALDNPGKGGSKWNSRFGNPEKGTKSKRPEFGSAVKGSRSPGLHRGKPMTGSMTGSHRSSNSAPWDRSGGKGSNTGRSGKGKSFQRRQSRDAKYGHGGRKSFKKTNTAESSAGFSGFKRKKGMS